MKETDRRDKIPFTQLIAFGLGGLIPIALFNCVGQLMGLLGNISLGLSAFWLGVIMVIPRLWDAFSDPMMGYISDNTRTRFGRRKPFLLLGGISVAVSFVVMWWIPSKESVSWLVETDGAYEWFQFSYILFWLLVFYTACTMFEIPHGALGMEMSPDYHERTKLFSAKSFFGNTFAIMTPWLFFLANLEVFKGPGGTQIEGMGYVAILVALVLIPLSVWWSFTVKEPGLTAVEQQEKVPFWANMKHTATNRNFLMIVGVVFILAMGFNFVGLFGYYIPIFYLYGGDTVAAGPLLGINGTVWAVTGLVAVFPLNFISHRLGKTKTMFVAIGLMSGAQLSKIICYNPEMPYLVVIPTILLSTGMLFFFTLASSMVGDVCDEDNLNTGTRSEGSYYSVFWWFIKLGTAVASMVTGALIVFTSFDEAQVKVVDSFTGGVEQLAANADLWSGETKERYSKVEKVVIKVLTTITGKEEVDEEVVLTPEKQQIVFTESTESLRKKLNAVKDHFATRESDSEHNVMLKSKLTEIDLKLNQIVTDRNILLKQPQKLSKEVNNLRELAVPLKLQPPRTLFLMRAVEIGLPVLLSILSMWFLSRYPLTEERCYEIKEALRRRNQENHD